MPQFFSRGLQVSFSPEGEARVRAMPEAWGLHTAVERGEVGEVVDVADRPAADGCLLCVEFPSGGAYQWDGECFEPVMKADETVLEDV